MQKVKLSETEKKELEKIREDLKNVLSQGEDFQVGMNLGWLFGLIDRIAE